MSSVELRRIIAEWRLRMQRVKDILQPSAWTEKEWRQFSQALALLVRDHGQSWIIDPTVYWDLRWKLQDGGELICQVEHVPDAKTSLVVAQTGGFAAQTGSYTWLWAEFNPSGDFARDPYWVDGSWRDALTALLLPLDRQSSYMLAGRTTTPDALMLQDGARPNDGVTLALPAGYSEPPVVENGATPAPAEPAHVKEPAPAPAPEEAPVAAISPEPSAPEPALAEVAAAHAMEPVSASIEGPLETPVENGNIVTNGNGHGNGHHEALPDDILSDEKDAASDTAAEQQARFRRLRAKAHFAESLRRIPPLGRNRSAH
jgi:hypothetical protein